MSSVFYNNDFKLNGISHSLESLLLTAKAVHYNLFEFLKEWTDKSSTIMLQTSGTTGIPKKLNMSKNRLGFL